MNVTKTISAENIFSDSLSVPANQFSISVSGTFVATVTLQKSYDGTNWNDVEQFTYASEWIATEPEGASYRIGVKTGDYTSGTITVRLGV